MAAVMDVARIGRFDIVSTLGRGAQGTVYLAQDTHLDRRVAVKTLRLDKVAESARAHETAVMLAEARIVGKLSHPNIVALFDAGEDAGVPYLVFEYVEGQTLGDLIGDSGTVAPHDAVRIASGLLAGVDYAHEAGVVHRDLKPANIMITREGVPRVMDFGIASHTQVEAGKTGQQGLSGTPSYMAPEYLSGAAFSPRCDVFAAGMVLYEMLTGAAAVKGATHHQTMYAIVKEPFARPSTRNQAIDEKLEAIVMRALEKDPLARYASAAAMLAALSEYANPQPQQAAAGGGDGATLDFLLRRMRYKSDFPVLSSTISTVNKLVASENERSDALADGILKDVSLTNKLLRMVNTAYFQQFGGSVSTISRAVSILGFQKVRNAALSLMLFEHLQNKAQAADLKDHVTSSYFSGVVSRELTPRLGMGNLEEAFICSMFHRLGRLLAVFYLHDESCEVTRVAKARGIAEDLAAVEVLGMSYSDLGLGVARYWNLPQGIVASMKAATTRGVGSTEGSRLRALSDLSNRLADAVVVPAGKARDALLGTIETEYGQDFGLKNGTLTALLETSAEAFTGEITSLGLPMNSGAFMQGIHALNAAMVREEPARKAAATAAVASAGGSAQAALSATPRATPATDADSSAAGAARSVQAGAAAGLSAASPGGLTTEDASMAETMLNTVTPDMLLTAPSLEPAARAHMLAAGIQDITSTLAADFQLNDVLRIILETMYRAIGFNRVMLCTRDPASNSLRARLGFGDQTDAIIKRGFQIPLEPSKDVFYGAISKLADICIEDCESAKIRPYIPDWYRRSLSAHGFVLFPVAINKKPVALIYADHAQAGRLRFADGELNLLKTLRNQAILAIRQKSSG